MKTRFTLRQILFMHACCLLFIFQASAQQRSLAEQWQALVEPESEQEFFVIKKELNISTKEFLSNYLPVLQLAPHSEMRFVKTHTNDIGITSSFYQQYVNNYKVKGADMVINEKGGRVKYINGRYLTKSPIKSTQQIEEQQGLTLALKEIQSTNYLWLNPEAEKVYKQLKNNPNASYFPHGELMYVCTRGTSLEHQMFILVWKFAIHVSPQIHSYEVYIDASTGELVNKIPLTLDCSAGTSTTLWNGAQTIYTQLNAGTYRSLSDCNAAQIHTFNGNGDDDGVGATYYTDLNNAWPSTNLGKFIAQTHWSGKETRDYYFSIHGRDGYDDAGADYNSYINAGYTGNAFWTGSAVSFGGNADGTSPLVTLDVAGHEHTHGMIDFTSNLVYEKESGALNESFADCIGQAVEDYAIDSTDWEVGGEIFNGGLRDMSNPKAKGDPDTYLGTNWINTVGCIPDCGSGGNDCCGVHTNSGVQNFWFYLLSVGGSGTNDNGVAYTVTGITIDKARLIAYDCMIALSTSSQYTNARSTSIQKAKDRYGDCSNEAEQTTRAWRAVGVGAAYVEPTPLTITVSTTAPDICKGGSATVTAFGASTYQWSPSGGSGNPKILSPLSTTIYTVTGTNAEQCTGTKTFTIQVNELPTVKPTVTDEEVCAEQTTNLGSGTNQTIKELFTNTTGTASSGGNVFNIYAYNNITITDFKMHILSGTQAEVYYNPGGYGNADLTSSVGWTKLGSTVNITPAGSGSLTDIPTTANLTIPAGNTYGIMIVCNGNNYYNVGTAVGLIEKSNPDLYITEGHAGTGFGGTFNFTFSPRVFNGTVVYRTNYTSYLWAPAATLSSATVASPVSTPISSTTYTLTATDGNGCTGSGTVKVYRYPNPTVNTVTATPSILCAGSTSQLNVSSTPFSSSQSLFTTLESNNGSSGNVFNVTALNTITITNVRMHILSGDSAQVWYKAGGYGNTSLTSSVGWTKLGNTVAITPAGLDALTTISTTANLNIPAGQTYGILVVCNGSNRYTNGTAVGNIAFSNPDMEITEGHGGTGFNGAFSMTLSPRVFNGQIDYTSIGTMSNYSWSPNGGSLNSSTIQNPIADPRSTTNYTVTVTDVHGCTARDTRKVFVDAKPMALVNVSTFPCLGDSAQIITTVDITESDSLFSMLEDDNGNAGNMFDVTFAKALTITDFKMNIDTGITQAEVWYKLGGYGGANVISNVGWTKLGATVNITAAGQGALTRIPTTANLTVAAGTTYGFAIVATGGVNYTNGTAVGNTVTSNPDMTIKEGHGGVGFGGAFSFTSSPRIWNGEIIYTINNGPASYSWTPNTNMSNSIISNPKAAPLSNTTYTVTVTDVNGCTGTAVAGVVIKPLPTLGTATATPSTICIGSNINLSYTQPAGIGCFGAIQTGFAGSYTPANWTQQLVNSNGSVNTAGAPNSIVMTSSDNFSFANGQTSYSITIPCSGILSFNWSYSTTDNAANDYPRYSINGGILNYFPGYQFESGDPEQQTGTFTLQVSAGQVLMLQMHSTFNLGGAASLTISNFKAPYQTTAGQSVVWYSAPVAGSNLGNGNPQTHTPIAAGGFTYYGQISSSVTGCTNTTRAATNSVTVSNFPIVNTSATSTSICTGGSTTLNANGAVSYIWNPGGLVGASVNVSPAATTTYTVIGTNAFGCTATATRVITVAPCSTSTITVKAYIQGYYLGGGMMTPVLANQGVGVSALDVDNAIIELHNSSFPYAMAFTFTGMLKTNGNLVCNFPSSINGNSYYIVFKHRNTIQTWSANPVLMSNGLTYDFTNAQTKAYANNQTSLNLANTIWGMFSGDINQDENMDLADFALLEAGITNFDFGFQTADLDGNGNVELADVPFLENNINDFIFSNHP
jgi:Zn-dependent metalloprotease